MSLTKLKIESHEQATCNGTPKATFIALINPATISRKLSVSINTQSQPPGRAGSESKYRNTEPETISFDLYLDGTGAIDDDGQTPKKTVTDLVNKFLEVALAFDGKIHEPPYTKINWGTLEFKGRITTCDISYTLFDPDGKPLRAKLSLSFSGASTPEELNKRENRSSPDLSHTLVVNQGDTLPLMCNKIYKDSTLYVQVARINGLVNFRNLIPGTTLRFPPIK